MKSSHLISLILTVGTIGLSMPARADQAVVNESTQTSIINGSGNFVNQTNNSTIRDRNNSRRGNTGTSVHNRQTADVAGDSNKVQQSNQTQVDNHQRRTP